MWFSMEARIVPYWIKVFTTFAIPTVSGTIRYSVVWLDSSQAGQTTSRARAGPAYVMRTTLKWTMSKLWPITVLQSHVLRRSGARPAHAHAQCAVTFCNFLGQTFIVKYKGWTSGSTGSPAPTLSFSLAVVGVWEGSFKNADTSSESRPLLLCAAFAVFDVFSRGRRWCERERWDLPY